MSTFPRAPVASECDNDPAQQGRDLKIEAPIAYPFDRDFEGSRILYLEALSHG